MLTSLLNFVETTVGSQSFVLAATSIAFTLKAYLLFTLISRSQYVTNARRLWFLLILILISSMIVDSSWILKLIHSIFFPANDYYQLRIFWVRISWAFFVIQYQALALFIEGLVSEKNSLNIRQKIFLTISSLFVLFFVGLAFIHIDCMQASDRSTIECEMLKAFVLYGQFALTLPTIIITFLKVSKTTLPRILKTQFNVIMKWLVLPHLASDFIQFYPFGFFPSYIASSFAVVSISTLLLTFMIYYCSRKVMILRFLNFQQHIDSHNKFVFIDNFKDVLEQLSHTTSPQELHHITQTFFKDAFRIPLRRTILFVRNTADDQNPTPQKTEISKIESCTETILSSQDLETNFIHNKKILIYDEVAFSHFYEKTRLNTTIIQFLEEINADIFIPIYEKQKIIAYIVVERDARAEFYSNVERDEMIVFSSYLGNIIHLLQNSNLESLIHQQKELREELYAKHQEINQYKESIRSFFKHNKQKEIGIVFYKNRRFIFGNQTAKELIKININTQDGHPITQALKQIARQVEEYKTSPTCFTKDSEGNKLILCGVPNLEYNNVIITVYYPDIADIIAKQTPHLKDPTKWDYLLYLETTQSGKLINQLIPGSGEHLLSFKIHLLKTALSKKATLLSLPTEDLLPTVEILHHISLRETLHVLTLQGPEKNYDTAIKLFGINPIFGLDTHTQPPLLKKLDNTGTLFIQNIQFLSLETQEYLAEFISYGIYRTFKTDQKIVSNVRIICSTNQDLQLLVQEGKFSKNLFNELKKTSLVMPSLMTLPEHEIGDLADGFTEQALKESDTFKNLLELSEREKLKIAHQRPVSLQELKTKVQQILVQKSKKNEIFQETQFDPAYEITDPDLIHAARLGKHALRDPKIMTLLWNKFQNQNKIAIFLGVNRSSVNRRCKDYNIV
jgi:transcriptional regulator with GAF, ATPase, and Fis domain